MWDEEEIEEAIREHPVEAAKSLAAVQLGETDPVTVDGLAAAAAMVNSGLEELWVSQLVRLGALDAFAESLRAHGIPLDAPRPEVTRRGVGHTLVRVTLDEFVTDLVPEIQRRVRAAGLALPDPAASPGVSLGAAAPEGAARDRAATLAGTIEGEAAAAGLTVWLFFDNPSVAVAEPARLALEGFVAAALVQPHLRLVVAGFETVPLPGQEFPAPSAALGAGPPGLVVEYLGGFTRSDVLDFLTRAGQDLTGQPPLPATIGQTADELLAPRPAFNGIYREADLETLVTGLRSRLRRQNGGGTS